MGRRRQLSLCALIVGWLVGCHERAYSPPDAGADAAASDGLAPLTLDISVTGCATFDVSSVACTGTAPLDVSFSPVGSSELTSFLWTFGDGTPSSSDRAPEHTYALPGSYDVTVTGARTVGTVSQQRRSLIAVQPVATGGPCDVNNQCGDGLRCLCQPGTGCGAAFLRGICSTACDTGFCGAGAACAAYAPGISADAGASADADAASDAAATLCLAACQASSDCAAGFVCEQLPAGPSTTAAWVRGCLPLGAAGDLGASCRDESGALDGTRCTTGLCADLGTLGVCTAACDDAHPCPSGTGCAHLSDGRQLCLAACSAAAACTRDPSLTCRSGTAIGAGADAGGGFWVTQGDPTAAYCAPD